MRLALQSKARVGMVFWRSYHSYSELEDRAYELLRQVLMEKRWAAEANTLTHGEQRKLEIAILLALDPELLLLDEPTAGMSLEEVPAILELIQQIKAARNRTIMLVEHKFDMIMTVSDSIAVLKEGRLICDDYPEAVACNSEVLEAYLGGGGEKWLSPSCRSPRCTPTSSSTTSCKGWTLASCPAGPRCFWGATGRASPPPCAPSWA